MRLAATDPRHYLAGETLDREHGGPTVEVHAHVTTGIRLRDDSVEATDAVVDLIAVGTLEITIDHPNLETRSALKLEGVEDLELMIRVLRDAAAAARALEVDDRPVLGDDVATTGGEREAAPILSRTERETVERFELAPVPPELDLRVDSARLGRDHPVRLPEVIDRLGLLDGAPLDEVSDRLVRELRALGGSFGGLGVARAAVALVVDGMREADDERQAHAATESEADGFRP